MNKLKKGFTLIELLVVIAIIAVLVAFTVANFVGARSRARDVRKRSELTELKNALRLYYNDYARYPGTTQTTNTIAGCGPTSDPSMDCVANCGGQLVAGGTSGCGSIVYMKLLPVDYDWYYVPESSNDDFCMWTSLENKGDSEIAKSQARCNSVCATVYTTASFNTATDFVMCAD